MTPTSEWGADRLDLARYLRRLGQDGPDPPPTAETLRRLHRAHLAAIPFENLDIALGRGISIDLPDIEAKLVTRRRGGYCYEHGLLFGAALERLGFEVRRALARVGGEEADPARARTHMALRVRADGSWWLADVGFGSGLLAPILLADGEEQRQGDWTFRVRADGDGRWTLLERRDDWAPLYAFDEQPQHVADVFVANYYTSTHPNSPFVGKAVAVRKDEHALYELIDGRLTTTRPGRPPEHRDLTDAEITDALRDRFGVVVGDAVGPAPTGT